MLYLDFSVFLDQQNLKIIDQFLQQQKFIMLDELKVFKHYKDYKFLHHEKKVVNLPLVLCQRFLKFNMSNHRLLKQSLNVVLHCVPIHYASLHNQDIYGLNKQKHYLQFQNLQKKEKNHYKFIYYFRFKNYSFCMSEHQHQYLLNIQRNSIYLLYLQLSMFIQCNHIDN